MRKHLSTIIRMVVTFTLITIIAVKIWPSIGTFLSHLKEVDFIDYFYCFLLLTSVEFIGGFRIYTLFKTYDDVNISFLTQVKIFLIGLFFNNFMLGSTGGDVIRAYYLSKRTSHKKTEVVATVFLDRIIGVLSMIFMSAIFILLETSQPQLRKYFYPLMGILVSVTLCGSVFLSKRILRKIPFLEKTVRNLPFADMLIRVYNTFHKYHNHKFLVIQAVVYSITLQMMSVSMFVVLGRAIGIDIDIIHYFAIIPLVFVINALPISLGGLGVGEAACAVLLSLVGVPKEMSLALAFLNRLVIFAFSTLGGFVYLLPEFKGSYQAIIEEEEKEEENIIKEGV